MEAELPKIQTAAVEAENASNRLATKTKKAVSDIRKLALATAEDVNSKNKKPLGKIEKKIEKKVTKAINGMHEVMKKYITAASSPDLQLQASLGSKSKLGSEKSPKFSTMSSAENPLLSSLQDLQAILEQTSTRSTKRSKRNKSSISERKKRGRSSTSRVKSKRDHRSRSYSMGHSPIATLKSQAMESKIKTAIKSIKSREAKENRIRSSISAK